LKTQLYKYQEEVAKYVYSNLRKGEGITCCLPTATGKTIIFINLAETLLKEGLERILVLEPTRYLVEQTGKRFIYELGDSRFSISYIHSGIKERRWDSNVVVTTPESALTYIESELILRCSPPEYFPLVIVDECHHTVGQDPFAKVIDHLRSSTKIGFSALIIQKKKEEIESLIGPIKAWTYKDLEGKGYEKPPMIAEVYDSPLTEVEREFYRKLYEEWLTSSPNIPYFPYYSMTMSTLARDGIDALRDSAEKPTGFGNFLRNLRELDALPERPHKLTVLRCILEDYEGNYEKAIVFVHRVVTAKTISTEFSDYNPVEIIGRISSTKKKEMLVEAAKRPDVKLIVATSAGDEGIDIPEIDLLIFWSHMVAPTRFYQRLGRGLRMAKEKVGVVKKAIFISTPDTRDYDTIPESLYALAEEGIDVGGIFERLPVLPTESKTLADTVSEYMSKIGTTSLSYDMLKLLILKEKSEVQAHIPEEILDLILGLRATIWSWEEIDIDEIKEYLKLGAINVCEKRLRSELSKAVLDGHLAYFYDVETVSRMFERTTRYLHAMLSSLRFIPFLLGVEHRSYVKTEELERVFKERPENFSDTPISVTVKSGKKKLEKYYLRRPIEILNDLVSKFAPQTRITIHPSITGYLSIDDRVIEASVNVMYGTFRIKNVNQVKCALMNASALSTLFK